MIAALGLISGRREGILCFFEVLRLGSIEAQLSSPQEHEVERLLELGPGDYRRLRISESSSKGNGIIELCGVRVHIYDEHDDGVYYVDSFLKLTRSLAGTGDGRIELVFSGEVLVDASAFEELSFQKLCIIGSIEVILRISASGDLGWELRSENVELRRFLIDSGRVVWD